ncbi:MAG: hypothetical protein PUG22_04650 [Peptoniphilaceae bacterium]|nr:hypothetical protein [Peptoniphilaceae bacterium]
MSKNKKMGRPTDNPRKYTVGVRLSDEEKEKLLFCCKKLNKTRTDIIALGIEKTYRDITENNK